MAFAPSHTARALSIIEVRYLVTTFRARSVYPMSKWVLKTTTTSSTAAPAGDAMLEPKSSTATAVKLAYRRLNLRHD